MKQMTWTQYSLNNVSSDKKKGGKVVGKIKKNGACD